MNRVFSEALKTHEFYAHDCTLEKKDGEKLIHNSKYNNRSVKRVFSAGLKTLCIHQVHDDERSIHHFQHGLPGL